MSIDTAWFIKMKSEEKICKESVTDDYRHTVVHVLKFFKCRYLAKVSSKKKNDLFKPMNKLTNVYTASVVYSFITYEQTKKGYYTISNTELCKIIVCCVLQMVGPLNASTPLNAGF